MTEIITILITAAVGIIGIMATLFGTLIGIGGSLLVTWLSHRYETKREKQKREEELEDIKHSEKREVLENRIKQAEEHAKKRFQVAQEISEIGFQMIKSPFAAEGVNNIDQPIKNIHSLTKDTAISAVVFLAIGDDKLDEEEERFQTALNSAFEYYFELDKKWKDGNIDKEKEQALLIQHVKDVHNSYKKEVKRFDELRAG
jgi:hypothetical protein